MLFNWDVFIEVSTLTAAVYSGVCLPTLSLSFLFPSHIYGSPDSASPLLYNSQSRTLLSLPAGHFVLHFF